ncbi:MAG: hypothetical protein K5656_02630 [Lachnospiraceae bacterium]|nr:hypothetical protein [Lachnospiraceae bacterium]
MRDIKFKRILAFLLCVVMALTIYTPGNTVATNGSVSSDADLTVVDEKRAEATSIETTTEVLTTSELVTTSAVHEVDYDGGERINNLIVESHLEDSVKIRWYVNVREATGYIVYRKDNFSNSYEVLVMGETDGKYLSTTHTDSNLAYGVKYTYLVQSFYKMDDGTVKYGGLSPVLNYTREFDAPTLNSAIRTNKKVKVKWIAKSGVNGYEVYRSKGSGSFKKVKLVKKQSKTSVVVKGNALNKVYRYKIRAYIVYNGNKIYSKYSDVVKVDTSKNAVITKKFKKLKKKYPEGYYWNHMGETDYDSTTITSIPCNHARYGYTYCNSYVCPTGYLGLQCYGFAWKMSDLIYGKSKKYTKHKKFAKAKVGDVIRYSGHSVIITQKCSDYIVVGECNYGGTCIIKWGRHIYKSELSGATYFHRNL